ncbi:MAG: YhfC family intramembrane metalloprotease, partial [Clostridiales bacterium]|nr:YhfC family intramembrane metalloprotease [Clostridiales bacterium]
MEKLIPSLSINAMALSALIGLAIPVALYIILRKKGANHLPFWTGCVTFVLFALVLEQLAYSVLMKTSFWLTVSNNIWLLGIFGGFMAGLFEETGRFLAFKTVLRKKRANNYNGLMYGAGHGGIEAVILLSVTMIINVIFSLQMNAGQPSPFGGLDAAQQLMGMPFWMFLVGAVERIGAVAIHMSLSVLVWFAAKNGKKFWFFPLAILLHLLVDAVAVILSRLGVNVWLIEGAVYAMAIA